MLHEIFASHYNLSATPSDLGLRNMDVTHVKVFVSVFELLFNLSRQNQQIDKLSDINCG